MYSCSLEELVRGKEPMDDRAIDWVQVAQDVGYVLVQLR